MTTDLEHLLKLREAVCGEYTAYLDPWERPTDEEVAFFEAAHAALSPEGCVTKELERRYEQGERDGASGLAEVEGEITITRERYQAYLAYEVECERLKRDLADSRKENRYLLDRNVKYTAMLRELIDGYGNISMGPEVKQDVLDLLNEVSK